MTVTPVSRTPQSKQYFHLLSALRGIAAILVVLRHTALIFAPIQFPMGYMAVDIFFLLSGVVIEASYGKELLSDMTLLRFVFIRVVRIYPLYILGTALTLLTILVAPNHQLMEGTHDYDVSHKAMDGLLNIFLLPNLRAPDNEFPFNGPAWSLFFETAVNVTYASIVTRLTMPRLLSLTGACGIALLFSILHFHRFYGNEFGWTRETFIGGFFRTGWSFFLGVIIYRLHRSNPLGFCRRHSGVSALCITAIAAALLMGEAPKGAGAVYYVLAVFIIFPALIYAALSVEPGHFVSPVLKFLGDTSYAVYTTHVPMYLFLCSVVAVYTRLSLTDATPWAGFVFLILLIGLSYALDKVYDRPVRRYLRQLWRDTPAVLPMASIDQGRPAAPIDT
jgi:peptidoglycan/LPS O-acetylase OafA/YrhL